MNCIYICRPVYICIGWMDGQIDMKVQMDLSNFHFISWRFFFYYTHIHSHPPTLEKDSKFIFILNLINFFICSLLCSKCREKSFCSWVTFAKIFQFRTPKAFFSFIFKSVYIKSPKSKNVGNLVFFNSHNLYEKNISM